MVGLLERRGGGECEGGTRSEFVDDDKEDKSVVKGLTESNDVVSFGGFVGIESGVFGEISLSKENRAVCDKKIGS